MEPATGKWLDEFGEVEGHEGLAQDDERPGPEDRDAADTEGDGLVGERAGRHADVAERHREDRQEPETAPQLRFDAQRAQMRVVTRDDVLRGSTWSRHEISSSHRTVRVRAVLWS